MWFNRFVAWLLRSPLHSLLSGNTMLITVTGRKSGRAYTTPVNYASEGTTLWLISRRERTWWRNVRDGTPVKLWLRGREVEAYAEVLAEEADVVAHLPFYLRQIRGSARSLGVRFKNGAADPDTLASAAREWLMVRVQVGPEAAGAE